MKFKKFTKYAYVLTITFISCAINSDDTFNFDSLDIISDQPKQVSKTDDSLGDDSLGDDSFDTLLNSLDAADRRAIRSCAAGDAATWIILLNGVKLPQTLNEPLYKKTSIPLTRNLINYPTIQLCTYQNHDHRQFTTHLFYNQTFKKQYRPSTDKLDGRRIGSYLNIENKSFLEALDLLFELAPFPDELRHKLRNIDTKRLLWTFGNAKLEERRMGIIGHFVQKMGTDGYFEAKLPIYWMMRNLNFTQEEKDYIAQQFATLQGNNSGVNSFDENAFARKHIIMDALGAGTLELSFCKTFWKNDNKSVDLGVGVLLPTDCTFKRGLYGTYFLPSDQQKTLSFCDLFNISGSPATWKSGGKEEIEKFLLGALDHLSSVLLQCPLGYNNHLGFSFKISPYWQVRPNIEFNGLYNFEILLPHEQQRFFVPKNVGIFSDKYNNLPDTTDAEAEAKLAVLQKRITTIFYPRVLRAKMFPGFIFTSTSSLHHSHKSWNFVVGYNGWFQSSEKILSIDKESRNLDLDIAKTLNDDAYAIKIFGKIHRIIHSKRHDDVSLSLWGDATVFNKGVGNDFSLGISFDSKF